MKYLLMVKYHQENQNPITEGGQLAPEQDDHVIQKGGRHAPEFLQTDPRGSACSGTMGPITFGKAILNQNSAIFLLKGGQHPTERQVKYAAEYRAFEGGQLSPDYPRCDTLANNGLNSKKLLEDIGYEPKEVENDKSTSVSKNYSKQKKTKIEKVGDNCRKCGEPVIKKTKKIKPNQTYYFEYYLLCPSCKTMYMTEDGKREIPTDNKLFE